ncbi:putative flippase GtrA [Ruminiclostridium sufflavum DSM 19573]|uniref:Putative flippase GtrA n=1 Tax=Ruminiclostridium sufflavum DSM 19573 TaxID=1121337 RepID=A0A318XPE7_9FIRM|nr:GtrA family protein [Ruminiclostridium sufflavum]PYG87972.1 putative flippase GtrA [Ruminiclostridium sufflavum DSM 19573]
MVTYNAFKNKFFNLFGQIIKYGLVGIINTLITAVILFTLMNCFGVSYKASNAAGYIAGFINSFFMNKLWTFKENRTSTLTQFIRFTAVFVVCYLLQRGLLIFLVENLIIDKNIAQLIGMAFYTIISFIFNKLFSFKD